jgi:hypothetical protein
MWALPSMVLSDSPTSYSADEVEIALDAIFDAVNPDHEAETYEEKGLFITRVGSLTPFEKACNTAVFEFGNGNWNPIFQSMAEGRGSVPPNDYIRPTADEADSAFAYELVNETDCLYLVKKTNEQVVVIQLLRGWAPSYAYFVPKDTPEHCNIDYSTAASFLRTLEDLNPPILFPTRPHMGQIAQCYHYTSRVPHSHGVESLPRSLEYQVHWWLSDIEASHEFINKEDFEAAGLLNEWSLYKKRIKERLDVFPTVEISHMAKAILGIRSELISPWGYAQDPLARQALNTRKLTSLLEFLEERDLILVGPRETKATGTCLDRVTDPSPEAQTGMLCHAKGYSENDGMTYTDQRLFGSKGFAEQTMSLYGFTFDESTDHWIPQPE